MAVFGVATDTTTSFKSNETFKFAFGLSSVRSSWYLDGWYRFSKSTVKVPFLEHSDTVSVIDFELNPQRFFDPLTGGGQNNLNVFVLLGMKLQPPASSCPRVPSALGSPNASVPQVDGRPTTTDSAWLWGRCICAQHEGFVSATRCMLEHGASKYFLTCQGEHAAA